MFLDIKIFLQQRLLNLKLTKLWPQRRPLSAPFLFRVSGNLTTKLAQLPQCLVNASGAVVFGGRGS